MNIIENDNNLYLNKDEKHDLFNEDYYENLLLSNDKEHIEINKEVIKN